MIMAGARVLEHLNNYAKQLIASGCCWKIPSTISIHTQQLIVNYTTTTTKARGSVWSIGHRRPLAIALCSGLILLLLSSLYLAAWALPQCLASSCCEAGLSSSFPAGSRSELGVWCWMLASWGCVRSSPTSSSEFVLLLVPVPLAPTGLYLGSSLAIGRCRCAAKSVEECLDFC